ncbi:hypothetical protein [Streptomyces halstedii]|uniref:hypothetical protein n=1 Tax=Streptomyces halstedii TaxID=1944 RepID=UPI00380E5E1C
MAGDSVRRSYDTGASTEAQGNIQMVIARLEQVIQARDAQVKARCWTSRPTVWLKTTLEKNDDTAHQTLARAKAAVDNIG